MGMLVTKKQSSVHLVWFKRDLRLPDHKPLLAAARTGLPFCHSMWLNLITGLSLLRPAGNGLLSKIVCASCGIIPPVAVSPYVSERGL